MIQTSKPHWVDIRDGKSAIPSAFALSLFHYHYSISLRKTTLRWVKQSWEEIPEEMVRKSFKTCGISNALDGTEDDAIYDDEMPEVADDDMEDEFETDSEEDDDD